MLWLVTTPDMKYKAKQAVDTFFVRLGDLSSAGLVWLGTRFFAFDTREFALGNAVLVVVWLAIALAIGREHERRALGHAPPLGTRRVRRITALLGLALGAAVTLTAPAAIARSSERRALPDYDGRGDAARAEPFTNQLLWAPRVLLFPAYVVAEYGLRRPLGYLITNGERHQIPQLLFDLFTFGPEHKAGIVPTALVEFGFEPSVGVYGFWDDAGFRGHDLRLRASTWGPHWLSAGVAERVRLSPGSSVTLSGAFLRRPDLAFYGIGPDTRESNLSRYSSDRVEVKVGFSNRISGSSSLETAVGYRGASFARGDYHGEPSLDARARVGVFALPPGYSNGYRAPFWRGALTLDTRAPRGGAESGARLELGAEQGTDFGNGPASGWVRYGATLGGFWDIGDLGRVLSLSLASELADPLGSQEVPFTELSTLGGPGRMPGFRPGRLVGRSSAVATLRYSWPIWVWLDGSLQAAIGNVFGEHLHVSIGGALLVSGFWSTVNECFDAHALKQRIARIGASATLGGLLGGALLERAAHAFAARDTLLLIALVALSAAGGNHLLARASAPTPASPAEPPEKRAVTSYFWTLALLVACAAAASAFGDLALKRVAAEQLSGAAGCVRFFALFYTATSLASFVLQAFVSRRLLEAIGIGGTLSALPLSGVLLGALAAGSPSLWLIGVLRGADLSFGPSLFRSAFEPLYAAVSPAARRRIKSLIDVVFDKSGDAFASLCVLVIAAVAPGRPLRSLLLLATSLSVVGVVLALRAFRGYVSELELNLRRGTLRLEGTGSSDRAPHLMLSLTTLAGDASAFDWQVPHRLDTTAERGLAHVSGGNSPPERRLEREAGERSGVSEDQAGLILDVQTLLGRDLDAIRAALSRPALDPRLAPFITPQLANDELARSAILALRGMGAAIAGLLSDFMLSAREPLSARRRIPQVLRVLRGEPVVRALVSALGCDALDIRRRAALALLEVVSEDRSLVPERRQVFALALREASRGPFSEASLDYLFAVLSLCFSRDALELARHALGSADQRLRGMALEYLESLLPEALRGPLLRAIERNLERRAGPARSDVELRAALRRSIQANVTPLLLANELD
jgi:hypothetical protein